jgi:single-strand DNA-binding protein
LQYDDNKNPFCIFTVASNRFFKVGDDQYEKEISYFSVRAENKLAIDLITDCHPKTSQGVRIVGRLKQKRWVDSELVRRSEIIIIAEHIEFKKGQIENDRS